MFNDKITKKIVESAKKVLEAKKDEVPPVVMGRLPDVEFKKSEGLGKNKKMPETSLDARKIPTKKKTIVYTEIFRASMELRVLTDLYPIKFIFKLW